MSVDLDLIIDSNDESVDMKAGLASMQGISDAIRTTSEAILTGKVSKRKSHKNDVRTSLKLRFKGSYGQGFSLDLHNSTLINRFNEIGRDVFMELISYFISESLYKEHKELSNSAQLILDELGETSEEITDQIRVTSLKNIHQISLKFNQPIKIRYRQHNGTPVLIAAFDTKTAQALTAKLSKKSIDLNVSITRLNIHTGNGRLQIKGELETVAFGFNSQYKNIKIEAKKLFSENLDKNNGLPEEQWLFLKISVLPIMLPDGKIIKYIINGFYEN